MGEQAEESGQLSGGIAGWRSYMGRIARVLERKQWEGQCILTKPGVVEGRRRMLYAVRNARGEKKKALGFR